MYGVQSEPNSTNSMKKLILGLLAAAIVTGGTQSALANGGWSTAGKVLTGLFAFDVATRVLAPPVVYYSAPPVTYYSSPPVVYQQAPVYVHTPAYVQAPAPVPAPAGAQAPAAAVQNAPTVPAAPVVGQPAPAASYTYPQQVVYAQPQAAYAQPTVVYTQP